MARQTIPTSGLWSSIAGLLNSNFVENYDTTGWAQYSDTQYTAVSPFSLVADTDTLMPNNAGSVVDSQLPSDITSYYSGGKITGQAGDGVLITVDLIAVPTNANTTTIEIWFDIGGAVGELYRRIVTFPKGVGVDRPISFSVSGYQLDTWETNGAAVWVNANGTCDLSLIRYVVSRSHKAQ